MPARRAVPARSAFRIALGGVGRLPVVSHSTGRITAAAVGPVRVSIAVRLVMSATSRSSIMVYWSRKAATAPCRPGLVSSSWWSSQWITYTRSTMRPRSLVRTVAQTLPGGAAGSTRLVERRLSRSRASAPVSIRRPAQDS